MSYNTKAYAKLHLVEFDLIDIDCIQNAINYKFLDKKLLKQAFVHSSYGNEEGIPNNERLEFLGDSVLGLVVAEYLFKNHSKYDDGELSKAKSAVVSADGLRPVMMRMDLLRYLQVADGAKTIKSKSKKISANLYEAIVGAIFLDGGFDEAKSFVLRSLSDVLSRVNCSVMTDYKSLLQEYCQQRKWRIEYVLIDKSGSDNNPIFNYELKIDGKTVSDGSGGSKKAAEQEAARKIVEKWRIK